MPAKVLAPEKKKHKPDNITKIKITNKAFFTEIFPEAIGLFFFF